MTEPDSTRCAERPQLNEGLAGQRSSVESEPSWVGPDLRGYSNDGETIDFGLICEDSAGGADYCHRALAVVGRANWQSAVLADRACSNPPPNTTESEDAMRLGPTIRRLATVLMAGLVTAALAPATVHANAQGARQTAASDCPEGVCPFRATRTWMVRSSSSWDVPSSTAGVEWLAVVNDGSGCPPTSCIVQQGYGKWTSTAEPTSCATGTGGDVKQFYYSIDANGNDSCEIGQVIASSEGHTQKLSRCNGTEWCTYIDGDFEFAYPDSGVGSTAPLAVVSGEFTCNSCQTSSTVMRSSYGAGGTSNPNWQVSDAGDGSGFHALVNSDTSTAIMAFCSGSSNSHWVVDPVSTSSMWDIYWANGGTNC
jgi:hypothetical protein